MPTTYTLGSWAVILSVVGWVVYSNYYRPTQARKRALSTAAAKTTEKKKEPKRLRKMRKDDGQSNVVQESLKVQQKPRAEHTIIPNDADQDEDETNDKVFARQLASAKVGTLMPAKSQDGARQRSIKQARAQEKPAVVETSSDNGTAGADADDDRSSQNSPEIGATTMASTVASGDVSDMLEKSTSGPSILRLTSSTTPAVLKKAKPVATNEVGETKKQRQNRKKIELAKQARAEEEKERKVLLEKQRRTVREAEGRVAKDGSTFMATNSPSKSAWTAALATENNTNGNGNKTIDKAKDDFLDTYDAKAPTSQETTQSESELAGSDWQKVAVSIPEEEQVRRALEDSDSWKTVSKDKRKKKTQSTQPAQATKPESNDDDPGDYAPPRLRNPPAGPGQVWGMTLVNKVSKDHWEEYQKDVQDSEWEVA